MVPLYVMRPDGTCVQRMTQTGLERNRETLSLPEVTDRDERTIGPFYTHASRFEAEVPGRRSAGVRQTPPDPRSKRRRPVARGSEWKMHPAGIALDPYPAQADDRCSRRKRTLAAEPFGGTENGAGSRIEGSRHVRPRLHRANLDRPWWQTGRVEGLQPRLATSFRNVPRLPYGRQ